MIDILLLVVATVILFFIRKWIQVRIQGLVLLMGGSRKTAVYVYSLLFLPGVIIHEITHFLTAALLGVRTGDISIFPEIDDDPSDSRVALGSVKVAKTDFIRGSIIGATPFIVGCIAIYALVHIYFAYWIEFFQSKDPAVLLAYYSSFQFNLIQIVILYLILAIGNTMFVSKEDTRSWPVLAIIALVFLGLTIATGNWGRLESSVMPLLTRVSQALLSSFVFVIIADMVMAGFLFGWQKLLERLTKKRVVFRK